MSSNLFFFLEGLACGIVIGAGLCLWVMWKDKIAMQKDFNRKIDGMQKEIDDAMERVSKVIRRWP